MLTITLDTCCYDARCYYAEVKELKKLHEKGEIEVWRILKNPLDIQLFICS